MHATLAAERICQQTATAENKINKETTPLGRKVPERIFAVCQVGHTHEIIYDFIYLGVVSGGGGGGVDSGHCIPGSTSIVTVAAPENAETEIISRFIWIFV